MIIKKIPRSALLLCGLALVMLAGYSRLAGRDLASPSDAGMHLVLELGSITVALMVTSIAWEMYRNTRYLSVLVIGVTQAAYATLMIQHALAYNGMPEFITVSDPIKSREFWYSARLLLGFSLIMVPLNRFIGAKRRVAARYVLIPAFCYVLGVSMLVYFGRDLIPKEIIGLMGPISFDTVASIGSTLLFIGGAIENLYFTRRHIPLSSELGDGESLGYVAAACSTFAISEIFMGVSRSPFDTYVYLGHIYSMVGNIYIFHDVFRVSIAVPFARMQEAVESEKKVADEKTRFIANVSHDVRTPLTVIRGYSGLMLGGDGLPDEILDSVRTIDRNAELIQILIDDLLDLNRIDRKRMELKPVIVRVLDFVNETKAELKPLAEAKGLELSVNYAADISLLEMNIDPVRLKQIFHNVIGNAIKYTEKGRIDVEIEIVKGEKDQIVVSVKDTGIGIEPEMVARLFHEFERSQRAVVRGITGTGLGLTLARNIARLMGGDLWLKDTKIGVGSQFCFYIPVQLRDRARTAPQLSTAAAEPSGADPRRLREAIEGHQILIVEDSADAREYFSRVLKGVGADVALAPHGQAALEKVEANEPELILMDMQMPVMSGDEATRALRRLGYAMPIVALTGKAMCNEDFKDVGFSSFLSKPVTKDELLTVISRYLAPAHS